MNASSWALLICFQVATIHTKLINRNHTCVPSSYTKICILENLYYKHDEQDITHSFPPNHTHIRILGDRRSPYSKQDLDFSAKLYGMLGQPRILEVGGHALWDLEIPRGLRLGSFVDSRVRNLVVEHGTDIPALVFLDLSSNVLRDISAVQWLINLEVLYLADNAISTIDPRTMQGLTKLRHLDLSFNDLSKISLSVFPKSLTHLSLQSIRISVLNYDDLCYPSLEEFDIERNYLTSIDGAPLVLAMPKLKVLRIAKNSLKRDDLDRLLIFFQRQHVSVHGGCWIGDEFWAEFCQAEPLPPRSAYKDILLSFVVIMVAIAFVSILRWIYRAINAK